jgi:hypothetical protein
MAVRPGRRRRASAGLVPLAVALLVAACGSPGLYEPPAEAGVPAVPSETAAPATSGEPPASSEVPAQTPLASGPPEPANDWQRVLAGIGHDGRVPLETALAAFELAIGDLPGVDTPGERVELSSGSGPIRWLLGHWDELSLEQQDAVETLLSPLPATGLVGGGPVGASIGRNRGSQVRLQEDQAAWEAKIREVQPTIEASLKQGGKPVRLKLPVKFLFADVPRKQGEENAPQPAAETTARDASGKLTQGRPAWCQIQVTGRGQGLTGFEFTHVAAHELFHCFQYDFHASAAAAESVAPWLAEGSAAWIGETISTGSTVGEEYWENWLKFPGLPLPARTYDGIGFFMHMVEHGVDPWPILVKMHHEGEKGGPAAYLVATKAGAADKMIDAWGPSYIRHQTLFPDWAMRGAGLPEYIQPFVITATLGKFESLVAGSEPQAGQAYRIDLTADVMVLEAPPSRGLIHFADGSQKTLNEVIGRPLCAKADGCVCPEDSPGAGHAWQTIQKGEVLLGSSGHTDGATITVEGWDVELTCKQAPEDFEFPEPCYCPPGALGSAPSDRRVTS